MAVLGWMMFGDTIRDEVTANVLTMNEYPQLLSICIIISVAVIPITKVPLK
jgi:vesicular inhibitory amino acid transporter